MRCALSCIVLVIGCIVGLLPAMRAVAVIDQGQLAVSGDWRAETIDAETAGMWVKQGDRLRLIFPKNTGGEFGIACKEPLPAGDWTADFWFVQYDDLCYANLSVLLGNAENPDGPLSIVIEPEDNRAEVSITRTQSIGGGYQDSGGRRIHWLRLVYQAAANQFFAYLNGEEISMKSHHLVLPTTPVIVRAKMPYKADHAVTLELAGYTVTPAARRISTTAQGLAQRGWTGTPTALSTPIMPALSKLANSPALTDYGRAYAYAAQILATRAGTLGERNAAWASAEAYLEPLIEQDPNNAAPLLAVMAASVTTDQRFVVDSLIGKFKARLGKPALSKTNELSRLLAHTALIDPGLAVSIASRYLQSYSISPAIISDLLTSNPSLALSAECQYLVNDTCDSAKVAWFLPELRAISPNYSQLVIDTLRESIGRKLFKTDEPDRGLSYAAWRLAPGDFPDAISLSAGITVPEIKADTLQAISDELEGQTIAGVDAQIETALLDNIAQFVPTQRNDSPGREIIRLVRWYESKGRHKQAMSALGQAKKHIGDLPSTAFRDTYAIYRFLLDMKDPEAAAWLDRAVAAAVKADEGQADYAGGWLYSSAIHVVVSDLARSGHIDEALAVAEKLNTGAMDMNYSNALAAIQYAVSETDLPRALALIDKMPDERQRKSSISGLAKRLAVRDPKTALRLLRQTKNDDMLVSLATELAPELAKDDPKATLALFKNVPLAQQTITLIRICAALPGESPEFTTLCGEAVKAKFSEYRARPADSRNGLIAELETLPCPTLLALQPYFSEEMDTYANILCAAVARESGVGNDPLWQRLSLADHPKYGQHLYWGCTHLRDAVSQWKQDGGKVKGEGW